MAIFLTRMADGPGVPAVDAAIPLTTSELASVNCCRCCCRSYEDVAGHNPSHTHTHTGKHTYFPVPTVIGECIMPTTYRGCMRDTNGFQCIAKLLTVRLDAPLQCLVLVLGGLRLFFALVLCANKTVVKRTSIVASYPAWPVTRSLVRFSLASGDNLKTDVGGSI